MGEDKKWTERLTVDLCLLRGESTNVKPSDQTRFVHRFNIVIINPIQQICISGFTPWPESPLIICPDATGEVSDSYCMNAVCDLLFQQRGMLHPLPNGRRAQPCPFQLQNCTTQLKTFQWQLLTSTGAPFHLEIFWTMLFSGKLNFAMYYVSQKQNWLVSFNHVYLFIIYILQGEGWDNNMAMS